MTFTLDAVEGSTTYYAGKDGKLTDNEKEAGFVPFCNLEKEIQAFLDRLLAETGKPRGIESVHIKPGVAIGGRLHGKETTAMDALEVAARREESRLVFITEVIRAAQRLEAVVRREEGRQERRKGSRRKPREDDRV